MRIRHTSDHFGSANLSLGGHYWIIFALYTEQTLYYGWSLLSNRRLISRMPKTATQTVAWTACTTRIPNMQFAHWRLWIALFSRNSTGIFVR
ncbi:hypothetical protein BANT918_03314 [Brevibacterium antiquum CNRZ 918]|uniref:Uncharacterized protein n=1 Tax=Brevibacterium antiquum CNRZ 918 TaxID=1255637 RepID=A0A2H1KZQ7_9MICO|nr:hypothetical protein BANT918_03314 [Brevibacterium antiquum CNRZ 918]